MERLTLQVDGPITGRALGGGGGANNRNTFSVYGLMGLEPEGFIRGGGEGGLITGIYQYTKCAKVGTYGEKCCRD